MRCERSRLINPVLGYLKNAKAIAAVNKDADSPVWKICSRSFARPRGYCFVLCKLLAFDVEKGNHS